jgi:hypothetical protein
MFSPRVLNTNLKGIEAFEGFILFFLTGILLISAAFQDFRKGQTKSLIIFCPGHQVDARKNRIGNLVVPGRPIPG